MKGWSTRRQLRSGNRGSRARGRGAHAHGSTATLWLRKAEPDRTVSRRLSIRSALSASSVPRAPTTPSSVGTIDHLPMTVSLRSPRCRGRRWSASSGGLRVPFSGSSRQRLSARVPRHAPESSCQTRIQRVARLSRSGRYFWFSSSTHSATSLRKTEGKSVTVIALSVNFSERDVDRRTALHAAAAAAVVSRRAASSSTHRRS